MAKWTTQKAEPVIIQHRSGTCHTCGGGKFQLRLVDHVIIRVCPTCKSEYAPELERVIREGKRND